MMMKTIYVDELAFILDNIEQALTTRPRVIEDNPHWQIGMYEAVVRGALTAVESARAVYVGVSESTEQSDDFAGHPLTII